MIRNGSCYCYTKFNPLLCGFLQVTVSEHLPAGSSVITVTATDRDSGENGKITYRVMSSSRDIFYIDPSNGKITVVPFVFLVVYNSVSFPSQSYPLFTLHLKK